MREKKPEKHILKGKQLGGHRHSEKKLHENDNLRKNSQSKFNYWSYDGGIIKLGPVQQNLFGKVVSNFIFKLKDF